MVGFDLMVFVPEGFVRGDFVLVGFLSAHPYENIGEDGEEYYVGFESVLGHCPAGSRC